MKECIIFGTSSFASMLQVYIEKFYDIKVIGYIVDRKYCKEKLFNNLPLVPFDEIDNIFEPKKVSILIALGYKNMNELRKNKIGEVKEKGYRLQEFIHPSVNVDFASLGEGNIILENVTLGYNTKIGDGNIIWNGCNISHETEIGNFNFLAPSTTLAGKVIVENNCFFGINSSVKGGRKIREFTLIGAGCYMNDDSIPYGVYVPNRSKKIENKTGFDFF